MLAHEIRCGVFEGRDGVRRAVCYAGDEFVRYDAGKGVREASRVAFAAWAKRQLCKTCGGTGYALVGSGHRVGQQVCPDPACTEPISTCPSCGHRRHLSKPEDVTRHRAGELLPCTLCTSKQPAITLIPVEEAFGEFLPVPAPADSTCPHGTYDGDGCLPCDLEDSPTDEPAATPATIVHRADGELLDADDLTSPAAWKTEADWRSYMEIKRLGDEETARHAERLKDPAYLEAQRKKVTDALARIAKKGTL
jgi:hypothetical protein